MVCDPVTGLVPQGDSDSSYSQVEVGVRRGVRLA